MKIITRSVWSIKTGDVLEEDSFEYEGPIGLCGGAQPDIPDPPPPPRPRQETTVITRAARAAQAKKTSKNFGQASTLMTGGLGLSDPANTSGKQLLGR